MVIPKWYVIRYEYLESRPKETYNDVVEGVFDAFDDAKDYMFKLKDEEASWRPFGNIVRGFDIVEKFYNRRIGA